MLRPAIARFQTVNTVSRCFSTLLGGTKESFVIDDSSFLEVSGKDTRKFLQGLCTNDVDRLQYYGDSIASCFLNTKGRVIASTIMYNLQKDESDVPRVVLELSKDLCNGLTKHLRLYKLRSKVAFNVMNLKCTFSLNEMTKLTDAIVATPDARIPNFGFRILSDSSAASNAKLQNNGYLERFRILNGLALGPEIANRIPLECNLDLLHYICYSKGCYIGQELVARTKYKGVVRKRLVPFLLSEDSTTPATTNLKCFEPLPEEIMAEKLSPLPAIPVNKRITIAVGDKIYVNEDDKKNTGEIIHLDSTGTMGVAVMNLETLYTTAKNLLVKSQAADASDSDQREEMNSSISYISTFRPKWWPDLDLKTGNML